MRGFAPVLVDLVPRENAQAWLKHLRHTTPTLPFRSAGSYQRTNLAVAVQPGHTKELQSVQLERGLRIVDSPGVIFDDDDHIQGQKELLRNVVKPEDVDAQYPSVGLLFCVLLSSTSTRDRC